MSIKQDKKNYRIHSDKNKRVIKKSLEDYGAGRSILIDSENEIIAGNGVFEQAGLLNMPIKIIETDGNELIAIKRTDLKTKDEKRKQLALIDNHASDTSEFDYDLIQEDFNSDFLDDWEFELNEPNSKQEKKQTIPYKKTHILISFKPEIILKLKPYLDEILNIDDVEYEQTSN